MIVKIGGSVAEKLETVFDALKHAEDVKVIPGGWIFADKVRELRLNDEISHWMAILAMNLYGYYMFQFGKERGFELIEPADFSFFSRKGKFIILPYRLLRNFDELPHSWDVTSDAISVWIASKIGESRVVKITALGGVIKDGSIVEKVGAFEAGDIIDRFTPFLLKKNRIELFICSPEEIKNYILRGRAKGTFVGGD
ncbi:MAG: uridylate kinase [Archaeoglobaceae archaeon]|nr:uridylate kinase [Archaeoglobaceae archaeon]MDW8128776.1 uridylate kinase [Archaeoglobaceae archaeon]